ncbi:hypothetical protein QFZ89_006021 [Paraburkholderia youngii]
MRVELQRVALTAVSLLDQIAGPACALRHHVGDVDQFDLRFTMTEMVDDPVVGLLDSPIAKAPLPELDHRFVVRMLPADDDPQQIWPFSFVDQIQQGGDQLRVAITRDLHEDRVRWCDGYLGHASCFW